MKRLLSIFLTALLVIGMLSIIPVTADTRVMDGSTLVTFGDSITALSTWPRSVAKATNMHLINAGIGGNTTDHGMARFERDVLSKDPDFVIMSFATNDFYLEDGTNPRVTTAKYKENLQYFIAQVNAIGAVPILMTPPFLSDDSQGGSSLYPEQSVNLALDKYVVAMREVASATGTHLIDMHAVCDSGYDLNTFLIADGLHLADQGNQVYTDTIVSYLQSHFAQDPSAPRVVTNDPPAMKPGAWTQSLISFDSADWLVLFPGTMYATENVDGSLSFANTTGLWPEVHYSPGFYDMFYAPVADSVLTLDMELTAAANISLYFDGPTPTHEYTNTSVALAQTIASYHPNVQVSGDDLCGNQDIRVSIPLSAVVPTKYIRSDGSVLLSGVKMFVSGAADAPVTFNEFSVTANGGVTPTYYLDSTSLLPTSLSDVQAHEGHADYVVQANGGFHLSRAADSNIAWPSVNVTVRKTVDLHKTPYLHLKLSVSGGSANGFLNYTDAHGNSGSVQLSKLVDGTANDVASEIDTYVDLASAIGCGGTITVDNVILSVYGATGDAVTWHALSTAAESQYPKGDINGDGLLTTNDARYIMLHALESITLKEPFASLADMDGNGKVTTSDARLVILEAL